MEWCVGDNALQYCGDELSKPVDRRLLLLSPRRTSGALLWDQHGCGEAGWRSGSPSRSRGLSAQIHKVGRLGLEF